MDDKSNRTQLNIIIVLLGIIALPIALVLVAAFLDAANLKLATLPTAFPVDKVYPLAIGVAIMLLFVGWQTGLTLMGSGLLTVLISLALFAFGSTTEVRITAGFIMAVGLGSVALQARRNRRKTSPEA